MTFQKIAPLVTLAAHPNTPNDEARTSALAACKLVVEHALPVTACVGDVKVLDKVQSLIERAAHENTVIEEAYTCAVIACRLITRHEIQLLPAVAARDPRRFGFGGFGGSRIPSIRVVTVDGRVGNLDELLAQFFGIRTRVTTFRTEGPQIDPKPRQRRITRNKKKKTR